MSSLDEIRKRVEAFERLELPGQLPVMHMGTAYLVKDLLRIATKQEAELTQLRTERERLKDDSEYARDRQYDRGYALGLKAGWQHATTYWEAVRQEDAGKTPSPTPEQLRERHRVSFEAHFYPSAALTQREGGDNE